MLNSKPIYIMNHLYEKNIVEIKNEYTTFITNIIAPSIYEGLKSLYTVSLTTHKKLEEQHLKNPRSEKSPGVLKIFQTCLKDIPSLNNHKISQEAERIRVNCKCSEWFDDLIKAVVKSNIVLLTYSKNECDIVKQKHHEKIDTNEFIHKCYIESARIVYNNPELFWHEFPTLEIKRNQRDVCELIKIAIREAIRKMLPMRLILQEYLNNDYSNQESDKVPMKQYINIKEMLDKERFDDHKPYYIEKVDYKAIESDSPKVEQIPVSHENTQNKVISLGLQNNDDSDNDDNFYEEIIDDKPNEKQETIKVVEQPIDALENKLEEISNRVMNEPPRKLSKTGAELQNAIADFKTRNNGKFFSKYYT